jgi:hypothetical protein
MKKANFPIPRYNGSRFTWSGRQGFVDASDLGLPPGVGPGQRVWADACDVGFIIQGKREDKLFVLDAWMTSDAPGLIERWDFVSADGFRAIIYND